MLLTYLFIVSSLYLKRCLCCLFTRWVLIGPFASVSFAVNYFLHNFEPDNLKQQHHFWLYCPYRSIRPDQKKYYFYYLILVLWRDLDSVERNFQTYGTGFSKRNIQTAHSLVPISPLFLFFLIIIIPFFFLLWSLLINWADPKAKCFWASCLEWRDIIFVWTNVQSVPLWVLWWNCLFTLSGLRQKIKEML